MSAWFLENPADIRVQPKGTPMTGEKSSPAHSWRFFRAGGFDQVRLETGADLLNLDQLDQKLWVALACPTGGLEFDPKTLALIDTDKDGRIRAPELIAAIKWVGAVLKDPDDLVRGLGSLPFERINDATPEGKQILASAKQICANLGNANPSQISLAEVSDASRIFANTTFNGDGVITPESASDDAVKSVIHDIMACFGTVPDRSGKPGIDQSRAHAFFADATAYDSWVRKSEDDAKSILPAGAGTGAALEAVRAVKPKIDDYFGRCRLAAFDPRALPILNRKEEEYLAAASADLTITADEIANFPLAQVGAGKPLPLSGPVNPAHAAALERFRETAIKPLLGEKADLDEASWAELQSKLAPYQAWSEAKAGSAVEKLGVDRLRAILSSKASEAIRVLIDKDKALEPEAIAILDVEKMLRFLRDLHRLAINFVNFKDLYDGGEPAIFQAGVLFLDQRSCHLCLPVEDAARHASMAGLAGTYLAYCDCVRKGTGEKRQIVAAFTNGDSDNLMIGRNGVFYDRKNRDWDATITKIIENPISVRQAFWAPYKKLVRLIEEQVAKRAAAAQTAADTRITSAATVAAQVDKVKTDPKKVDVGTVAALGVAFGALATAVAAIAGYISGLLKLAFWKLCLAVLGLMLIVSGPSMIIAWLKLRKRNLGPILDANGWAINSRARINVPFGASLTRVAHLPKNSHVSTSDRFGERPSWWPRFALVIIVLCFVYSLMNDFYLIHKLTDGRWGKAPKTEQAMDSSTGREAAGNATNNPAPPVN